MTGEKVSRMVRSRNAATGVRISNSKKRTPRFSITRRQILLVFVMLILFMGSSIGYVWSNFEKTQIGYDLSQLKNEEMRLLDMNRKLRLELASLKSPERLERLAINKLGLKPPAPDQIVVLP